MEPVLEVPYTESRKSGQQQSPRHSLLLDGEGRPIKMIRTSSSSGAESPIIPDTNTLKRKLHNLFLSGPSLRSRHSDGSLGSAASVSPVSTGSPMEWPSGEVTPTSSSAASSVFPPESLRSRDITLEEELQTRLANMGEAARTWQSRWRLEREDTCRLNDHLARCETESKRLIESVAGAYTKKVKMLEDTLMRAMKANEQLLIEKELLDSRLRQSKEIIDLQRHEIEKEFTRARKDVELLRTEVGHMQSRTQRLEKENDSLKSEKQLLTHDLDMFSGNTKRFNTSLQETDVRCELYRVLLEMAMQKLKTMENGGQQLLSKERAIVSRSNAGRYVLKVDDKNPVCMHIEDVSKAQQENAKDDTDFSKIRLEAEIKEEKIPSVEFKPVMRTYSGKSKKDETEIKTTQTMAQSSKQLEIKEVPILPQSQRTRYLPVVHMTSESYSQSLAEKLTRSHSPSPLFRHDKAHRTKSASFSLESGSNTASTPTEEKSKWGKKGNRRFSFGKDSMKPKGLMKQLAGGHKSDNTTSGVASYSKVSTENTGRDIANSGNARCQVLPRQSHSLNSSFGEDYFSHRDGDLDVDSAFHQRRPRSLSDSEDVDLILDATTSSYSDGKGSTYVDIQETSYRTRSNTMDGAVETPRKNTLAESRDLKDSPMSSNEELRSNRSASGFEVLRSRRNGFSGLSSSPDSGSGKTSFMMRKYKTKDISDLFRVFTSDHKDPKSNKTKKGKFGK